MAGLKPRPTRPSKGASGLEWESFVGRGFSRDVSDG